MSDHVMADPERGSEKQGPRALDPRLAKRKLTYRTLRFLFWDRVASTFPGVARRNNFPIGSKTVEEIDGDLLEQVETVDVAKALGPVDPELEEILRRIGFDPTLTITSRIQAARLRDAQLLGHTGALHQQGVMLAPDSLNNWPKMAKPARLSSVAPDAGRINVGLMTAPAGAKHFFHGFMDRFCPLILFLERLAPEAGLRAGDMDVWVNSRRAPFHDYFYRFAEKRWPGLRFRMLERNQRLDASEIILPLLEQAPLPRTWAPSPFYAVMSEFVGSVIGAPARTDRRIFIDRSDAAKRQLANAAEIGEIAARHGFEIITPGGMEYPDQLRAFAEAEAIVATHGAALMNLIAARPGAKVLEMFVAEGWANDFPNATASYVMLTRARGLAHHAWTCATAADKSFAHEIDPQRFDAQLTRLLA